MVKKKDDELLEQVDKPKKRGRPRKNKVLSEIEQAVSEAAAQSQAEQGEQDEYLIDEALLEQIPEELGLLSLRENVLFNSMIMPIYETRETGIEVIEKAYNSSKFIFISAQKNSAVDTPKVSDLYEIGTVGLILRMIKMPNGHIKALIQGISRAKCLQKLCPFSCRWKNPASLRI